MDRQAAVKIIKDTFESSFDKGRFINLNRNLVALYRASSIAVLNIFQYTIQRGDQSEGQ